MSSHHEMTPYDPSREPDFWSEVPGGHVSAPLSARGAARQVTPIDRMRRLLRGRAPLAAVLAVTGALIGASLGWASQERTYHATGWVRIDPYQSTDVGKTEALPAYRQFMNSELKVIEGLQVASEAMQDEAWRQTGLEWPATAFTYFVDAKYTADTSYIHITFQHPDPLVAEAGSSATVRAYEKFFLDRKSRLDSQTIESLQGKVQQLSDQINALKQTIAEEAKIYGGLENLSTVRTQLETEDMAKRQDLRDVERNLQLALETRDRVLSTNPLSVEELAFGDLELSARMAEIADLKRERERLITLGWGVNHRSVQILTELITKAELDVEPIVERVRRVYYGQIPNPDRTSQSSTISLDANHVTWLEMRRERLLSDLARIDKSLTPVVTDDRRFREFNDLIAARTTEMHETERRIADQKRNSEFQQQLANIEASPPPLGSAAVAQDRRRAMALVGAVFGFGVPLGAVLLIGLLDRRFRFSEDAAEAGERATLLGILPNLPDRLSDPNQASIAAHCVHQIRTMLQINHGSHESRAFAVTSASRGDGKTSLALALGLSYAASGARTLLIDTDLQYGGLSVRLGVNSEEGTMDALSRGELLQFVCETDVADLAILPIGRAAANHAGAFSPAAVEHMLDLAKRHFDVIICDTGPILGSIEATPVAAAVDGVVLAVSRGQSRPLVSKALKHLESLGAKVAGLVFNRAQASDFERSVSGMNLRNGSTRPRLHTLPNGTSLSHNN